MHESLQSLTEDMYSAVCCVQQYGKDKCTRKVSEQSTIMFNGEDIMYMPLCRLNISIERLITPVGSFLYFLYHVDTLKNTSLNKL